jgi:hypothetical protein
VELDDVTKVFYEHTNLGSRLKEIGRWQLVEEIQKTCKLPFPKCEQQNLTTTYDRFSKFVMFTPIHIANFSPNHVFWYFNKWNFTCEVWWKHTTHQRGRGRWHFGHFHNMYVMYIYAKCVVFILGFTFGVWV